MDKSDLPTKTNLLKRLFCIPITPLAPDPSCYAIQGSTITVWLEKAKGLDVPGGALRIEDERVSDRILVIRSQGGTFGAFRNRCGCSGFRVDPVPGEEKIRCCTLMQSTYDLAGKRLSGSAQKDLDVLPVEVFPDRLEIDISTI